MYTGKLHSNIHFYYYMISAYTSEHAIPITIFKNRPIRCKCAKSFSFWVTSLQTHQRGYFPTGPHWGASDPPDPLTVLSGNKSLCFSLRLCFSNDVCSAPNSWRTGNQRRRFMAGWDWLKFWSCLIPICLYFPPQIQPACWHCAPYKFTYYLGLLFKLHEIWLVDSQEIIKIVSTSCQILRLKCIKFDCGWGSAPDPAATEGAYSAPPDPLAGFQGPTSKGREGRRRGREEEGKEKGREGRGEGIALFPKS